jgi:membrane protein YqaA with SNARE-associated domain
MEMYLFAIIIIIAMNALPAFAPPTWMALVFLLLNYDLNPVVLVALGVVSATSGRAILAWYFRRFSHLVPTRFSQNMEHAGKFLSSDPSKRYAILALFLIFFIIV